MSAYKIVPKKMIIITKFGFYGTRKITFYNHLFLPKFYQKTSFFKIALHGQFNPRL